MCALYLSFGYILLSGFAPDHFVISQFLLLLTLWLCSEKLKSGAVFNAWQTAVLFFIDAGVSLNNGLKVFLAAFATRRGRFFRPGYLLLAVVIPCAVMWEIPRKEYYIWRWPGQQKAMQEAAMQERMTKDSIRTAVLDTACVKTDSVSVAREVERIYEAKKLAEEHAKNRHKEGKPIAFGSAFTQFGFTDISTSRMEAVAHNLFGEALQLHADYPLGDVWRNRPAVVQYSGAWAVVNYTVEAAIVLLFLVGVWCGRRSRFLWTAMSFFLLDMVLHLGLGFGINEVYIMSAHYLFVLPIATAYLLKRFEDNCKVRRALAGLVGVLALWCFVWNSAIIVPYLLN